MTVDSRKAILRAIMNGGVLDKLFAHFCESWCVLSKNLQIFCEWYYVPGNQFMNFREWWYVRH
jgi:hypothetical protein